MSLITSLRSRRAFAGGLALAAGTAAIAAPAVAPPLSAGPLNDAEVDPTVNGDTGTYESCSAMFGLTDKSNANFLTFDVAGTASPLPPIGDGLTPILTVTNPDETTEECVPEVGFNDQASWEDYLAIKGDDPVVTAFVPYGGSPGYLVPNFAPTPVGFAGPAALAPTLSLTVRATDTSLTVTSDPADLDFEIPDDPDVLFALVLDELGGPTSEVGAQFILIVGGTESCQDDLQANVDLALALIELTGVPVDIFEQIANTTCDQIQIAFQTRGLQLQVEARGIPVAVTVNAPTPPTPTPTPTPAPAPVTPAFTG